MKETKEDSPELEEFISADGEGFVIPYASQFSPTSSYATDILKKQKDLYIHDVVIGKEIGVGSFGKVYNGTWQGARIAVKALANDNVDELLREAKMLKKLRHPNIVQYLGIYKSSEGLYMVTEYVEGGSLESLLRNKPNLFNERELIRISSEIAAGMMLLEHRGVIHRDLATRNILVDIKGLTAKVSDFGMSIVSQEYQATKGSPFPAKWAPPEVIQHHKYSSKSDVWSMGVVLYEIFTMGQIPYSAMTNKQATEYVLAGNRLSIPPHTPPQIANIMTQCWKTDPQDRPTFKNIYDVLYETLQVARKHVLTNTTQSMSSPSTSGDGAAVVYSETPFVDYSYLTANSSGSKSLTFGSASSSTSSNSNQPEPLLPSPSASVSSPPLHRSLPLSSPPPQRTLPLSSPPPQRTLPLSLEDIHIHPIITEAEPG